MILEIKHKGQAYQAIYDDEFHPLISQYKWYLTRGYARTTTYIDGKRTSLPMHRLILKHLEKHTHHLNENRLDNRLINLKPLRPSEHLSWHFAHPREQRKRGNDRGRLSWFKRGEENPSAILTSDSVAKIRKLHEEGISCKRLAEMFGIKKSAAWSLIAKKTWKHI